MKNVISLLLVIIFIYALTRCIFENFRTKPVHNQKKINKTVQVRTVDQRIIQLQVFFQKYNSPMDDYASDFVAAADLYRIDYRLIPAIAGVESTFGKFVPGCAKNNAFGWTSTTSPCGFYRFVDYKEAAFIIAKAITTDRAYSQYQKTKEIKELAMVYNQVHVDKWTADVNYFMDQIK